MMGEIDDQTILKERIKSDFKTYCDVLFFSWCLILAGYGHASPEPVHWPDWVLIARKVCFRSVDIQHYDTLWRALCQGGDCTARSISMNLAASQWLMTPLRAVRSEEVWNGNLSLQEQLVRHLNRTPVRLMVIHQNHTYLLNHRVLLRRRHCCGLHVKTQTQRSNNPLCGPILAQDLALLSLGRSTKRHHFQPLRRDSFCTPGWQTLTQLPCGYPCDIPCNSCVMKSKSQRHAASNLTHFFFQTEFHTPR